MSLRRSRGIPGAATGALMLALLAWPPTTTAQGPTLTHQRTVLPSVGMDLSTLRDKGDYYLSQGRRIALHRSLVEYSVRLKGERGVRRDRLNGFTPMGPGSEEKPMQDALARLRSRADVAYAFPVLFNPETGTRLMLTDEVVVKLKPGLRMEDAGGLLGSRGLSLRERIRGTEDELVLGFADGASAQPLEAANDLAASGLVAWAEPNFVQEYKRYLVPNDPLFANQWHLNNTGQGGAKPDSDVDAVEAWDLTRGSSSIVVAVVDDSVETTHEDLAPNLYVNPGEIAANGLDDDGNGLVDDVSGWDFADNDNNPNPVSADDNHGTAVSGVAVARGSNAIGVSGACPLCKLLPVRVAFGSFPDSMYANAIRYAWSKADVVNNSWGGGSPSATIQSAIADGITQGRGGKGSAIFFATGNDASGLAVDTFALTGLAAGTYKFRIQYQKDASGAAGDDTMWLAWASFPNQFATFQSGLPSGWTVGGTVPMSVVTDPIHTDESLCLTKALKAGTIADNGTSFVDTTQTVPTDATFYLFDWVSSGSGDGLRVYIDTNNDGTFDLASGLISDSTAHATGVSFPAAHPESIAVAATSDNDCRSYYSQYGPQVSVAASSNAGPFNLGIQTTDRTGAAGYDATNYTADFGGTSSATPLTTGVAGLVLSRNPSLRQTRVRQILQTTADKVGPQAYVAGRNDRYGFGRINALRAVVRALATSQSRLVEFDGDSTSDMTVYHEPSGQWTTRRSTTGTNDSVVFGGVGFTPVPGDYDGDGLSDQVVYHEASGLWFVRQSSNLATVTTGFGGPGYKPVRGDFDGDGKSDLAVYHPASGLWFIKQSSTGTVLTVGYGGTGYNPVTGDWDGDGKTDIAVFHPPSGLWFIRQSSTLATLTVGFGGVDYVPVTGDYDGDGKTDVAVFHPASALWFIRQSTTGATFSLQYGATGYTPVAGDYDGDGKTDIAVYHPPSGTWFARYSSTAATNSVVLGGSAFTPVN
jgi:subtilisin family serine protease